MRLVRTARPVFRNLLALTACAYAYAQWRGRTFGSTWAERISVMPGDDLVREPQISITHATTLPVPPDQVWPWLVQMGWGRGGWYTARLVDRLLFPANGPSADRIMPEHQTLKVGDRVLDGPPEAECWFTVVDVERERCLALRSQRHLPLSWRRSGRAHLDWTWVFALHPRDGGARTRLVFRWRAHTTPWWLTCTAQTLVVPADYVMSHSLFHGLRHRVRVTSRGGGSGHETARSGW